MKRLRIPSAIAVVALFASLLVGQAGSAYALSLSPIGTFGSIPNGATNDLLVPIYGAGTTSRAGYYGSGIVASAGSTLKFTYLGKEAGYDNYFRYASSTIFTNNTSVVGATWLTGPVSGGLIDFRFWINGSSGTTVVNGSNPDDSAGAATANFFTSFDGGTGSATSGSSLIVFLDDGGAGPDDNHDDMAVRIEEVPEPSGMILLGVTVLGLGIAGRRRRPV